MKRSELKTLIREITRQVVNEYTVLSDPKSSDAKLADNDPSTPPVETMTSAEKAELRREKEHANQEATKQAQAELDSKKKEIEFNKKKLDTQKRFDIPKLQHDIARFKGAKI